MKTRFLIIFVIGIIGFSGIAFAEEESGITYDVFDNPPVFFGDSMIIASTGKSVDGVQGAGGISVIDVNTNSLLYTISNPEPNKNDLFGRNIVISDSYIIVSVKENSMDPLISIPPKIYVFDGKTGSLLYTISNPNEDDESDIKFPGSGAFGRKIGSIGDNVIASSYIQTSDYSQTQLIHVFDGKTGSLINTINSPIPDSTSFGNVFESFDGKLAVYTRDKDPNDKNYDNAIHVFDAKNGSLLYTINDTSTSEYTNFGSHLTIINDNIVVGVPEYINRNSSLGEIQIFDGETGSLLSTINAPAENNMDFDRVFGNVIVPAGNNIAVRSGEMVYIFGGITGELLYTVDQPNLSNLELDRIVDSLEEGDTTDYPSLILIAGIAVCVIVLGVIVVGEIVFKKRK